ncbi:MAG: hypothetical protein M1812_001125 [Candelaria pacifica]|nr:MAG: hypothetical protein M1812_001125 [Candelaria pacifica]
MYLPQETLVLLALLIPSLAHATPLVLDISEEPLPKPHLHRRLAIPAAFDISTLNPRFILSRGFIPTSAAAGAGDAANSGARTGAVAGNAGSSAPVRTPQNPSSDTHIGVDNTPKVNNVPGQSDDTTNANTNANSKKKPEGDGKDGSSDNSKPADTNSKDNDKDGHKDDEKPSGDDGSNSSTTVGTVKAAAATTGAVSGTAITAVKATASNTQSAVAGPTTTASTTTKPAPASTGAAVGKLDILGGAFGVGMGMIVVVAAGFAVL